MIIVEPDRCWGCDGPLDFAHDFVALAEGHYYCYDCAPSWAKPSFPDEE